MNRLPFTSWKVEVGKVVDLVLGIELIDLDELPYWDLWTLQLDPHKLGIYLIMLHGEQDGFIIRALVDKMSREAVDFICTSISKLIKNIADNREPI